MTTIEPAPLSPESVQKRWATLTAAQKSDFLRAIGPRAAVREFRLSVVEVALAWRVSLGLEERLAHVQRLARD
jgi:hypothetical protein